MVIGLHENDTGVGVQWKTSGGGIENGVRVGVCDGVNVRVGPPGVIEGKGVRLGVTVSVSRRVGGGMGVMLADGVGVGPAVRVIAAVGELCVSDAGGLMLWAQAPIIKSTTKPAKKVCRGFMVYSLLCIAQYQRSVL